MDNAATKIKDHRLFLRVLQLIASCASLVAHEVSSAEQSVSSFSLVDRIKLKRTANALSKMALLAWIIEQTNLSQDQRAIRGGRSENIPIIPQKGLSITRDKEHANASKPDGDARD